MVTIESLKEQFDILGCNLDNEELLEQCIELCNDLKKDAEEFVEMWVAFSVTRYGNMDLTQERFTIMKNIEIDKCKIDKNVKENLLVGSRQTEEELNNDEDILRLYGGKSSITPKRTKRQRSPDIDVSGPENKLFAANIISSISLESQSRQVTRSEPGKILIAFGKKRDSWKIEKNYRVPIKLTEDPHVPSNARFMFDIITDAAAQRASIYKKFWKVIRKNWIYIREKQLVCTPNVRNVSQTSFVTWGRVRCDMQGKLNKVSAELESIYPDRDAIGNLKFKSSIVPLDLSRVQDYSIFPGQIIAVEGINLTGELLDVKNIFADIHTAIPEPPKLENDLKIVVASGPFTNINNLNYEPLLDLMKRLRDEEPHILILIGPFVEYTHPQISSILNHRTHQDLFEETVSTIMESIKGISSTIQLVIVPSNRDAHHEAVYPTPQYYFPRSSQISDLHLVPDPCILNIADLRIGITAIDILKHLGNEELCSNQPKSDKLYRLSNHILAQNCFYPLYPPAEEVNLDTDLWKNYAFMKYQPHILILPSDMSYFCKFINNCIVFNPGRLCKHSFTRIYVESTDKKSWNQNNITCEILRV